MIVCMNSNELKFYILGQTLIWQITYVQQAKKTKEKIENGREIKKNFRIFLKIAKISPKPPDPPPTRPDK